LLVTDTHVSRFALGFRAFAPAGGRFQSATVAFNPGDEVIVFTDGMVEAVNSAGEEFSDARLLDAVRGSPRERE
jgi:serine phosphatase RsbU (regulator of sigma subunit)